jgi:hypothetical protein
MKNVLWTLISFKGKKVSLYCTYSYYERSKCTSILYNGYDINIVDTPGHQDFGG